jgi:hypothetical protein
MAIECRFTAVCLLRLFSRIHQINPLLPLKVPAQVCGLPTFRLQIVEPMVRLYLYGKLPFNMIRK